METSSDKKHGITFKEGERRTKSLTERQVYSKFAREQFICVKIHHVNYFGVDKCYQAVQLLQRTRSEVTCSDDITCSNSEQWNSSVRHISILWVKQPLRQLKGDQICQKLLESLKRGGSSNTSSIYAIRDNILDLTFMSNVFRPYTGQPICTPDGLYGMAYQA